MRKTLADLASGAVIGLVFGLAFFGAAVLTGLYALDRHGYEIRIVPEQEKGKQ